MPAEAPAVDALTRVVIRACRELAELGHPQEAARLAANAWLAVRADHPRQSRHLDGAMHYIARIEHQHEEHRKATMTNSDRVLDVRAEVPKRRHELILETFAALPPGASYVLVNDHDPKPLRYQFEAEHTGEFSWAYLEEGPEVWRVRIGRTAAG
jgi:uncharacterized protein (DUF2249 family)